MERLITDERAVYVQNPFDYGNIFSLPQTSIQ